MNVLLPVIISSQFIFHLKRFFVSFKVVNLFFYEFLKVMCQSKVQLLIKKNSTTYKTNATFEIVIVCVYISQI